MRHLTVAISAFILVVAVSAAAQEVASLRRPHAPEPAVLALPLPSGSTAPTPPPPRRTLAAISLAPALSLGDDAGKTALMPKVHGDASKYLVGSPDSDHSLLFQVRIDARSKPGPGNSDEVAKRIKGNLGGTLNGNLGLRYSLSRPSAEGSLGLDVRVAMQVAAQWADLVSKTAATPVDSRTFGMASGEASVGVWLWWFYLGGQANYYLASSAAPEELRGQLHKRLALTGTIVGAVNYAASEGSTQTAYLQFLVTADARSWSSAVTGTLGTTFDIL